MLLKLAGKASPPQSPSTSPVLGPFASVPAERGRPRDREALGLGSGAAVLCSPLNFKEIILPRLVRAALSSGGKSSTLPDEVTAATLAQRYPELLPVEGTWRAMDQLRVHAGAPERSDAGLAKLLEYYSVLLLLESCFPSGTSDELAVAFTWSEAFSGTDKSPKKIATSCIHCEKAAVLFNLAAVHAQLAAKQSVRTTDGIKAAALHFQTAAGILDYIRVELVPRFSPKVEKTADMSSDTLQALTELMLAQANECYWEKASTDGTSDTVISQIATQTAAHYEALQLVVTKSDTPNILHKVLNPTSSRGPRLPRDWLAHARTKALLYSAIAHSHSPHPRTEVSVGHRIARLTLAKSLVERSIKEPEQLGAILVRQCEYHRTRIAAALRSLEVENKMLGESVPDARSLAQLRRLPDPVAAPIPFSPPEPIGTRASMSGLGFGHVLLRPAQWPEWARCVRTLDEVVNQLGPQVQQLLPKCDEIMALLQRSSSPARGTARGPDHGFDLDLNADKLVRSLQSLRADESVLSLAQLVSSLARASTTSQTLCARAQTMLDRVKVDHFAHDPKAFSAIAVLRPRLVALAAGVQHTADTVARLESASQAPETRGVVWNEWTVDRIRETVAKMGRDKGAGDDQVDDPIALDELAPYLVAVRADLAKFVARLDQIRVNLSSAESSAATREALLQQSASGQDVVERAERLIQRATTTQAQVADSVTQRQGAAEAKAALCSLARSLSALADLRSKAEIALSTALDQQEQLEALVVECERLPGAQAVGAVSSVDGHACAILPSAPLVPRSDALNAPRSTGLRSLYRRLAAKTDPAPAASPLADHVVTAPAPIAPPVAAMPSAPLAETTFYTAPTTPTPTRLYPSISRPPSPPTEAAARSSRRPSALSAEHASNTVPIVAASLVTPTLSVPTTELHPLPVRSRSPSASPAVHPPAVRSRTPSASPAPNVPAVRSRTPSASLVPPTVRSRNPSASPAPAPPTVRLQTPSTSPAQPPAVRSRNPSASLALPPSSPARRPSVVTPTAATSRLDPVLVADSAARPVPAASPSKPAPALTDELLRGLDAAQTRADRAAHVNEWTAEQVELAKERKRKWIQAAAAPTTDSSPPPPRATTHASATPDQSPPRLAATSMPSVHASASASARTLRRRATSSKNRARDREWEREHLGVGSDPVPLEKVLADSGLVASADSVTQQRTETEHVVEHFAAAAAIASGRVRTRSHRRTESGRSTHKVQGPVVDVGDAPVAFGGVPVPRPPSPAPKRVMDGDELRSARRRERHKNKTKICPDDAPLAWIQHSDWPHIGVYAVSHLPGDVDAPLVFTFSLILPVRNEHRVCTPKLAKSPAGMMRVAHYWSCLRILLNQIRYVEWDRCEWLTLDNVCPLAEEFPWLAQWLPLTLWHLTLQFISSGDGDQLGIIYEKLLLSLVSLKLFNDEDDHEVLDEESAVGLACTLSTQLTNLTTFYHHSLPFLDLLLMLDALVSRNMLMESLMLHLVVLEDCVKFMRGKHNRSTDVRIKRMHIFANYVMENWNQLLLIVRSLPKLTRMLMLGLPKWSAACVDRVVQCLVAPGLHKLHFDATVLGWVETHQSFPLMSVCADLLLSSLESLTLLGWSETHWSFPLASVHADLLPSSLESLTLPGGMPPRSMAKASRAGWMLPASLKHFDLSGSKVNGPDIDFLHSRLPAGLVSLAMRGCGLWGAPGEGLPPTIRIFDVSHNWDLRQGQRIALLLMSLRKLKMQDCPKIKTAAAAAVLAEVQQRVGMTRQGAPKLQIIGVKGINNTGGAV
ncbi:Rhophilin, Rho GTPase binding protein [Allomyces javanicus]|nr:Rhophilin, Rho GTPase binding protein [Allomyces javanicus]